MEERITMPTTIPTSTLDKFTTFGDLLRFLWRRVSITQMELANAVGYSDAQISRLEQNLRLPDIPIIESRFVPALGLEDEPKTLARLLELAANVRREDAPTLGLCPYKGLNYFDEVDADLFVGREALTNKLIEHVLALVTNSSRFLAVVGASGSGKSSLVRAGLVSALRWNKQSADWQIYIFTPSAHPLESLAGSLTYGNETATATLIDGLSRDPRNLNLFIKRQMQPHNHSHSLLVVDQFEELFTLCHSEEERVAFINNLLTVAYDVNAQTTIVITLRADFYAHCAVYPELREALAQHQEYIGTMNQEELRRAIEEPARRERWELEPGLVDLLLHDVGNEPGALPLLSHALLETWQRRRGRMMTLSGYASSGGVRGAIAETAETVFTDQFTREQQMIARRIFLRLTEISDENSTADTRRRATFNELILKSEDAATTRSVLKALADARLIMTSEDSAEVAHEALIREWPTLRSWLEDNRESLRLHRQLTDSSQEWSSANWEPDLLYRGVRLAQAREWAREHPDDMNALEHKFLDASIDQTDQEIREREALRQRELEAAQKLAETEQRRADEQTRSAKQLRVRNRVITSIGVVAVVLAIFATVFSQKSNANAFVAAQNAQAASSAQSTAQANAEAAQKSKTEVEIQQRISQARELAMSADNNLNVEPERSILLALESLKATKVDNLVLPESADALHRAIAISRIQKTFPAHDGIIWAMAYSPNGKLLATGGVDKTVRLWDTSIFENKLTLNAHNSDVDSIAFNPDGTQIATSSDDHTVKLWDVATGNLLFTLKGHTDWVMRVVYSPDGKQLATISADKTIRFWDVVTGESLKSWNDLQDPGFQLTYSPDGKGLLYVDAGQLHDRDVNNGTEILTIKSDSGISLFAVSADGTHLAVLDDFIRVLDSTNGQLLYNIAPPANQVEYMAFSPDGSRLAIAGRDRKVTILDATIGVMLFQLIGHDQFIFRFAFSPDGKHLASADQNGTIKFWSLEPSLEVLTIPLEGPGNFALSPDGIHLVSISSNSLKLFDLRDEKTIFQSKLPDDDLTAIAINPDGTEIATGGTDQKLRLWNLADGNIRGEITVTDPKILAIAYRLDGKSLAVAGLNGIITIYDHESKQAIRNWDAGMGQISSLAFNSDGSRLGAGTLDTNDAKIFDTNTGKEILTLSGHTNNPVSIAFNKDGTRIVTSGRDSTARLWDALSGKLLLTLSGHTSTVTSAHFSPDGQLIVTSSPDGTIRVWDAVNGKKIITINIDGATANAIFTPDGNHLITWDFTAIKEFTLKIEELIQIAHSHLTRSLTVQECQQYLHVDVCSRQP
jgi:WD40 repeat protein